MNIQVDPKRSNLASAMLNSKIRPRAVVGYGVKIFLPSPPNYVTRSPGSTLFYLTPDDFTHPSMGNPWESMGQGGVVRLVFEKKSL